jgi:hypothetical protein
MVISARRAARTQLVYATRDVCSSKKLRTATQVGAEILVTLALIAGVFANDFTIFRAQTTKT